MTQFIKCKFRETDSRAYTYRNDGAAVAVGDYVKVPDKSGDGWKKVFVSEVDVEEPTQFACKAILGLWEPEPKPEGDLLADAETDAAVSEFLGDRA
jgi:hypothetical protein